MKKRAVVNLKNFKLRGDILDVTTKGNTIISEVAATVLAQEEQDKDFISWNRKSIPSMEMAYDYAVAFFSLNTVGNKFKLRRIIKEIKRVLKSNGRILIWDAYGTGLRPVVTYDLKVLISEGDIRRLKYKVRFNPFRANFNGVMKILKRHGFSIENSRIMDNIYHIEAINTNEGK